MSPILKRDISDQIRLGRRLATVTTGLPLDAVPPYEERGSGLEHDKNSYASGSNVRQGIGVDEEDDGVWKGTKKGKGKEKEKEKAIVEESEADEAGEEVRMLANGIGKIQHTGLREEMEFDEGGLPRVVGSWGGLRNLLLEATPSLLLGLIGLVFTGELLEHLARWQVFRRVDELFILVPMIGNLKGNLEMCLSARLGTSANIGELDQRSTRRALIWANMTLLGLQALLISSLAAFLSFVLGLITTHRLGDLPPDTGLGQSSTGTGTGIDPGLAVGEQEWREGYTRPGWKQLVMVLATGMGAAGLSSAVLGSFMGFLIILSRWMGVDPDNITPPVAACLGDLLTLFILALLGTLLVGTMDTPVPLIAVICMSLAAGWFTRRVMRNQWVKNVAKGGWAPLIGAMLISSGTGMVLDKGVGKYRGFALLAISMTGLTGSIGAIHANRLSTSLHTSLKQSSTTTPPHDSLTARQSWITLYLLAFPCQGCFLLFVSWAGWIDLNLGWAGWVTYALTTLVSLSTAHYLTLFFWSKNLDPDSYTLPLHSAFVDFLGQLFLMAAYEICILEGRDVVVHDLPP